MCTLIYDHIADYNAAANNFAQMQLDDDEFMREPPQQSLAFKVLLLFPTTTTTANHCYYYYYFLLLLLPPLLQFPTTTITYFYYHYYSTLTLRHACMTSFLCSFQDMVYSGDQFGEDGEGDDDLSELRN